MKFFCNLEAWLLLMRNLIRIYFLYSGTSGWLLKMNGCIFRGNNSDIFSFCHPSKWELTLKGKNLLLCLDLAVPIHVLLSLIWVDLHCLFRPSCPVTGFIVSSRLICTVCLDIAVPLQVLLGLIWVDLQCLFRPSCPDTPFTWSDLGWSAMFAQT